MQDSAIKLVAGLGTLVVIGGAGFVMTLLAMKPDEAAHPLADKIIIEASLAMSSAPHAQPQKDFRAPDPKDQTEKISRDEHDPLKIKKDDPKKVEKDPPLDLNNVPKRPRDDDTPVGPVVKPFNPGEKTNFEGLDKVTKGNPYFGAMVRDMKFQYPEIARGDSTPNGCIELKPDGTIGAIKFDTNTGDDIQTLAEQALKTLKQLRNANPIPVPTELLPFTAKFLCFDFKKT